VDQAYALAVDVRAYCAADLGIDRCLGDGHAHIVTSLPEEIDVAKKDARDFLGQVLLVRQVSLKFFDDVRSFALEDGEEKAALAVEVAVDQPLGAAGALGDVTRGGGVEPTLCERFVGGVDEGGPAQEAVPRTRLRLKVDANSRGSWLCACARTTRYAAVPDSSRSRAGQRSRIMTFSTMVRITLKMIEVTIGKKIDIPSRSKLKSPGSRPMNGTRPTKKIAAPMQMVISPAKIIQRPTVSASIST
jgi:hypothetical protein